MSQNFISFKTKNITYRPRQFFPRKRSRNFTTGSYSVFHNLFYFIVHSSLRFIVVFNNDVSQKPKNEKLDTHKNHKKSNQRPDFVRKRYCIENSGDQENKTQKHTERKNSYPSCPEEVKRPIGVFFPKPDRDHIHESFHSPFPIVLCHAVLSRVVRYDNFTNFKSLNFQKRWDETVHFTAEINVLKTFPTIGLQAAAGIMNSIIDQNFSQGI